MSAELFIATANQVYDMSRFGRPFGSEPFSESVPGKIVGSKGWVVVVAVVPLVLSATTIPFAPFSSFLVQPIFVGLSICLVCCFDFFDILLVIFLISSVYSCLVSDIPVSCLLRLARPTEPVDSVFVF